VGEYRNDVSNSQSLCKEQTMFPQKLVEEALKRACFVVPVANPERSFFLVSRWTAVILWREGVDIRLSNKKGGKLWIGEQFLHPRWQPAPPLP
jgi:hypothetical protein